MTRKVTIDELRRLIGDSKLSEIIAKPKYFFIKGDGEYGFPIWLKVPREAHVDGEYMPILSGGCFEQPDAESERILGELGFSAIIHRTVMTGKWRQTKQGVSEFEFTSPAECSHVIVWGTNYSPRQEFIDTPKIKPVVQRCSRVRSDEWCFPMNVEFMCFKRQAALEPLIAHEEERLQEVIAQGDAAAEELKMDGPTIKRRFEASLIPKFLRLQPDAKIVMYDDHCTIDEGEGPYTFYFLWSSYDGLSRSLYEATEHWFGRSDINELMEELLS